MLFDAFVISGCLRYACTYLNDGQQYSYSVSLSQENELDRLRTRKMRRWHAAGKMMDTETVSSEPIRAMKYARKGT